MIALFRARQDRVKNSHIATPPKPPSKLNSSQIPGQQQPEIREPPTLPSSEQRQKKEQAWYSSISSRGKRAAPRHASSEHQAPASSNIPRGDETSDTTKSAPSIKSSKGLNKSSASIRSFASKRSFLGLKRNKSSASLRGAPSNEALDSYTVVSRDAQPPLPTSSSQATVIPAATSIGKPLPARLQELSVAFSDGLLDEEEYRMLRTAVLEKYAQHDQQDMEAASLQLTPLGLNGSVPPLPPSHRQSPSDVPIPRTSSRRAAHLAPDDASFYSSRSGLSGKSSRSRSSRFINRFAPSSRNSMTLKEDWETLHHAHRNSLAIDSDHEETLSINQTSAPGDLPVRESRQKHLPPLTLKGPSSIPSSKGTGSIRRLKTVDSVSTRSGSEKDSFSMARGFSQASSAASVVSNSSLGHKSLRGKALSSAGSFNSHGFETDDDPYAEATPKQLQHEIDQLFAEKKRVAEEFDQLIQQRNNSRKTSGTPAALSNKPDSAASTLSLSKAQKRLSGASSVFGLSRSGSTKSSSTHLSPPASSSGQRPTNGDSLGGSEYEDARSNAKAILALSRKRERVCTRYDTQLEFLRVKLQGAELRAKLRQ